MKRTTLLIILIALATPVAAGETLIYRDDGTLVGKVYTPSDPEERESYLYDNEGRFKGTRKPSGELYGRDGTWVGTERDGVVRDRSGALKYEIKGKGIYGRDGTYQGKYYERVE